MLGRLTRRPPADTSRRLTERDVIAVYRAMLGRDPDAAGLAVYREHIANGLTVNAFLQAILTSDEFLAGPAAQPEVPEPVIPPDYVTPESVLARYSLDELNEAADEYYRRVTDPTPLMAKPFTFIPAAPESLQSLGRLLGGLHLGRTMTVLDFGGGTGWLTRMLTQFNCQAICCDVSEAALDIGRRLMREQPPLGTVAFQPRFLRFDGHRLDLPDQSVDRIICFDAFHHVPNQETVIQEFGRVLRDGGIAGFNEPGPYHARAPQSQYEMKHHKVLENDIRLDEIWRMAQGAGFTDLTIQMHAERELGLEAYLAIVRGTEEPKLAPIPIRQALANHSLFFLHKGTRRLDSRSHEGLAYEMQVKPDRTVVAPGQPAKIEVTVKNTGTATWLATNGSEIFGVVFLAAVLFKNDELVSINHFRHHLKADVAPGERLVAQVAVPVPEGGDYRLRFDMVAEGVTWFELLGSQPCTVKVKVSG